MVKFGASGRDSKKGLDTGVTEYEHLTIYALRRVYVRIFGLSGDVIFYLSPHDRRALPL